MEVYRAPMLQVRFRIRRSHIFARASGEFRASRLILWCNLHTDVVEVHAPDPTEAQQIVRAVKSDQPRAKVVSNEEPTSPVLVVRCPTKKEHSVTYLVEKHGGLLVPPVLCEKGWAEFRMLVFDPSTLPSFFKKLRRLGEFEILSKSRVASPVIQELFMVSAGELLGGLTEKQTEALLAALQAGYYAVPRTATMKEIARRHGRPRTTMEEHLRKAEFKILTALSPYVLLGSSMPRRSVDVAAGRAVGPHAPVSVAGEAT